MRRTKLILVTIFMILILFGSMSRTSADLDPLAQGSNGPQNPPQNPTPTGPEGSMVHQWICIPTGFCFCGVGFPTN